MFRVLIFKPSVNSNSINCGISAKIGCVWLKNVTNLKRIDLHTNSTGRAGIKSAHSCTTQCLNHSHRQNYPSFISTGILLQRCYLTSDKNTIKNTSHSIYWPNTPLSEHTADFFYSFCLSNLLYVYLCLGKIKYSTQKCQKILISSLMKLISR